MLLRNSLRKILVNLQLLNILMIFIVSELNLIFQLVKCLKFLNKINKLFRLIIILLNKQALNKFSIFSQLTPFLLIRRRKQFKIILNKLNYQFNNTNNNRIPFKTNNRMVFSKLKKNTESVKNQLKDHLQLMKIIS